MATRFLTALFTLLCLLSHCYAQNGETRSTTVQSIKLFQKSNQMSLSIIALGSIDQLELHFDDIQSSSKNYYYTYELCNADWTPANLSQMDYIKGFSQNRIQQYRASSIAFTRYYHYQINLPQANCVPSKSGNYLLKVFLNGDTSNLLFSRRMMVIDDKITIGAQVQQPFTQDLFRTHQKLVTKVNFGQLDIFNPQQQVKVVILQNYRWDNAQSASAPTFIRGKEFEYSSEQNFIFEGGKEFRWLDLRSFRLQSERVRRIDYNAKPYEVYTVPDSVRSPLRYIYYKDLNGQYFIETLEDINPWWQSDYANVNFSFYPNNHNDFNSRKLFIVGDMNNYNTSEGAAMQWDEEKQAFTKTLSLKNGYYSYAFATKDNPGAPASFRYTEGNNWETENTYTILVYYRSFGARADELMGFKELNSLSFLNTVR